MIDEYKLIASLRASLNTGRETFPVDLIVECIEEQPKIGEWIPCSEQLPVQCGGYLCVSKSEEYCIGYPKCYKYSKDFYADGEEGYMDECIAWMPLPEPYKPKADISKMTNSDIIRRMTDDDLGEFLCKVKSDYRRLVPVFPPVDSDWTEWMQTEADRSGGIT